VLDAGLVVWPPLEQATRADAQPRVPIAAARSRFTGDFLPSCAASLASSWLQVQTSRAATDPKFEVDPVGFVDTAHEGRHVMTSVKWLEKPEAHDFPAAADYLAMLADADTVSKVTEKLQAGSVTRKKAKDILRAAQLGLLPTDNPHVAADLAKIKKGQPLSPILLVRGDFRTGVPLQIADGYHRVCASYHTDENTDIPVIIAPSS
jgi:hypothetical protein